MANIVYLVEHPEARKFSTDVSGIPRFEFTPAFIPRTLREDGFQLGQELITHMLVDHKLPASEFLPEQEDSLDAFRRRLKGPEKGFDDIYFGYDRHKTNIHILDEEGHFVIGSVLGYRLYERKDRLAGIVRKYVVNRPYDIKPPFFSIVEPESFAEVKGALEQFGLEVRILTQTQLQ